VEIRGVSSDIKATPESLSPAAPARLVWQVATVAGIRNETPRTRTLVLDVPSWPGHRAGQHVDVRLVADDGYQAQRSYSIASAPENASVEITVERLEAGEVSSYLCDALAVGDGVEIRGPIGGYFVWSVAEASPLFLVAGGSGIVPLMAMLRHRAHADPAVRARSPARLVYSVRREEDIIYRTELDSLASAGDVRVSYVLTRDAAPDWTGYRRRIDREILEAEAWQASAAQATYVCGPTSLVESVANLLVGLGHDPARIKTERFGPTG
jgi:ferredoxin-NADP reductase